MNMVPSNGVWRFDAGYSPNGAEGASPKSP
jgi:hypothetical protein